jgi:predicted XRE-type DNA-binding protein
MGEGALDSSGNVFIDLGFPPDEAAVLPMRADLMTGKWEKFSREMLITLATRAGLHVSLKTAAWESASQHRGFPSGWQRQAQLGDDLATNRL